MPFGSHALQFPIGLLYLDHKMEGGKLRVSATSREAPLVLHADESLKFPRRNNDEGLDIVSLLLDFRRWSRVTHVVFP